MYLFMFGIVFFPLRKCNLCFITHTEPKIGVIDHFFFGVNIHPIAFKNCYYWAKIVNRGSSIECYRKNWLASLEKLKNLDEMKSREFAQHKICVHLSAYHLFFLSTTCKPSKCIQYSIILAGYVFISFFYHLITKCQPCAYYIDAYGMRTFSIPILTLPTTNFYAFYLNIVISSSIPLHSTPLSSIQIAWAFLVPLREKEWLKLLSNFQTH